MDSIKFPDMLSTTTTNIVTDYEATLQNLKLLLTSEQGTLFGDPFFGLKLRKHMFEQNYYEIWDDILLDKIYTAIVNFIPQLYITRKDIKLERNTNLGTLSLSIRGMNQVNLQTNLYNIVLFQTSN